MAKAKLIIEFNGKSYQVAKSCVCSCKRDCDLYDRDRCKFLHPAGFPCHAINEAFRAAGTFPPNKCFKEVK